MLLLVVLLSIFSFPAHSDDVFCSKESLEFIYQQNKKKSEEYKETLQKIFKRFYEIPDKPTSFNPMIHRGYAIKYEEVEKNREVLDWYLGPEKKLADIQGDMSFLEKIQLAALGGATVGVLKNMVATAKEGVINSSLVRFENDDLLRLLSTRKKLPSKSAMIKVPAPIADKFSDLLSKYNKKKIITKSLTKNMYKAVDEVIKKGIQVSEVNSINSLNLSSQSKKTLIDFFKKLPQKNITSDLKLINLMSTTRGLSLTGRIATNEARLILGQRLFANFLGKTFDEILGMSGFFALTLSSDSTLTQGCVTQKFNGISAYEVIGKPALFDSFSLTRKCSFLTEFQKEQSKHSTPCPLYSQLDRYYSESYPEIMYRSIAKKLELKRKEFELKENRPIILMKPDSIRHVLEN